MFFKRKLYKKMLNWKSSFNGSSALLIKGARKVGKTILAEEFAKHEYASYILIDFSVASDDVQNLFRDLSDLDYLFHYLQDIYHVSLIERKSVIIFDNVQLQPLARQAIKHLVKDHRYDYIETGSFVSIRCNIENIVIPSEETRMVLYPMDFEEFCWAFGDHDTGDIIKNAFENLRPLGDELSHQIYSQFCIYMTVGGMPQAVNIYAATHDITIVGQVTLNIVKLYEDDFHRIDESGTATMLFNSIPANLCTNKSLCETMNMTDSGNKQSMYEIISNMQESMAVYVSYLAVDPFDGITLCKDPENFKLYLCDTGLLTAIACQRNELTINGIYRQLLNCEMNSVLAYIYENAAAQMLATAGNVLFYYTFSDDSSNANYCIDFLISRAEKVCPLQITLSDNYNCQSMRTFKKKFSNRILKSYLIDAKDIKKKRNMICLPIYMTSYL